MKKILSISGATAVLLMAGALIAADQHAHHHHDAPHVTNAVVVLTPMQNSKVQGTLVFTATVAGATLTGEVSGLTPGKHGFHIHEFGDLRDPAGKGAGGHYNPEGHPHGGPTSKHRHVGDLGNIEANNEGVATVNLNIPGLNLHHILGRSIVVHAKEDDLTSQPSGDAGDRIGVGVIGLGAPPAK